MDRGFTETNWFDISYQIRVWVCMQETETDIQTVG